MKRLSITIVNKSPFSIAASRAVSNIQECLDFIPGTAIRGSLASLWLKRNSPDSDFKNIFTEDKVVFGNLYKEGSKPIPLSAFSCKYYSGFLGDKEKHGVVDILLSRIRGCEKGLMIPDKFQQCAYIEDGKSCSAPMKKFKVYYLKEISNDSLISIKTNKRLVYHTAISHTSETALEGALYSQEIIENCQIFRGDIWIYDDTLSAKIESFINDQNVFYIGSDKSTGLGRFEILSSEEITDNFDKEVLKTRVINFNEKLGLNNGRTYFSLTLQSDAIITDKFMRYKTFIDQDDLGIKNAPLVLGIADTNPVQGWNTMTRLPKEDVLAIEKGSVFVFYVDNLDDTILDRLYKAETMGIGKRKGECFGRLTVCDSFHLNEGLK